MAKDKISDSPKCIRCDWVEDILREIIQAVEKDYESPYSEMNFAGGVAVNIYDNKPLRKLLEPDMTVKTKVDTRLSYSSSTLLKNCSQKYHHYKVAGLAKDPDSEQNEEAFNVGKAFHFILETNLHGDLDMDLGKLLSDACKAYEVEHAKGMLNAMVLRYMKLHKASGLKVVKCELALENEIFLGFVDVILLDPSNGEWWIGDLKTASRVAPTTLARLPRDTQLNLYSFFADDVAKLLDLDREKFAGSRYRVTTKSVLKQRRDESYRDHVIRTAKNIKSYDVPIPVRIMNPQAAWDDHEEMHKWSMDLREGRAQPKKNMSYCDSFFKPCPYWSACYGKTFTECGSNLKMLTENV
jgi:hypothetical protein